MYSNMLNVTKAIQSFNEDLVTAVCKELGHEDKAVELIKKLLVSIKMPKEKKDPNRIRKPKNAYMFFCDELREKTKDEMLAVLKKDGKNDSKVSVTDVSKKLGTMWGALSDKKKEKYKKLQEKDIERYEEQR